VAIDAGGCAVGSHQGKCGCRVIKSCQVAPGSG
jgi:hypothetical protein